MVKLDLVLRETHEDGRVRTLPVARYSELPDPWDAPGTARLLEQIESLANSLAAGSRREMPMDEPIGAGVQP